MHWGRCGSTVLGYLLHQHPRIYWDGEALQYHRASERWLRRLQGVRGEHARQDLAVLMRFARGRTYVVSAKGPSGYASPRELVENLSGLGFGHFVVLERRNVLRRVVSSAVGIQHKVWARPRGRTARLRRVRVPLTFASGESLEDRIRSLQGWYADMRRALADCDTLELAYEDHVEQDPREAYRAVCAFLGFDAAPVRVRYQRLNPFTLPEIVANFDEVSSALRGTEFEWMLTA